MVTDDKLLEKLSAYLDGELDDADRRAVEILSERDPEIAAELDGLMEADSALKSALDGLLETPVPLALARAIDTAPGPEPIVEERPEPRQSSSFLRIAAGFALLLAGGGVGGYLTQEYLPREMVSPGWLAQVADYHRIYAAESKHLVEVAATDDPEQWRSIETWLGDRTGVAFNTPDLSDHGLTYQGARQLVASGKPVAQLIYTTASGTVFALCFQSTGNPPSEMATRNFDDLDMLTWRGNGAAYVVVGPANAPELQEIAEAMSTQV